MTPTKTEMIEFLREKAVGLRTGALLHGSRAEQTRLKKQMRQDADMLDLIADTLRQSATVN